MKVFKRFLLGLALSFTFIFVLASCSKVSKSYADKINDSYKNGSALKYEDVKSELGDECIDVTSNKNGRLVAVKGINASNYLEKLQKASTDEKFDFISITVVNGDCTYALYATGTAGEVLSATTKTI